MGIYLTLHHMRVKIIGFIKNKFEIFKNQVITDSVPNFTYAQFANTKVDFSKAIFTQGNTTFNKAKFSGGDISFPEASGGESNLPQAIGGYASFL